MSHIWKVENKQNNVDKNVGFYYYFLIVFMVLEKLIKGNMCTGSTTVLLGMNSLRPLRTCRQHVGAD